MNKNRDIKSMSAEEIKKYIRQLEQETNAEPIDHGTLDTMSFFDWEDLIAKLEKERGFQTTPS